MEAGGETAFPNAEWLDKKTQIKGLPSPSDCAKGKLYTRPKKGDALLFFDLLPVREIPSCTISLYFRGWLMAGFATFYKSGSLNGWIVCDRMGRPATSTLCTLAAL